MIVQIYEIQTPEEAERCIEAGVDHIGSVLLSESEWRQPVLKEVINRSRGTGVRNSIIPLFRTRETLYRLLDYYQPHLIHFCENLVDERGRVLDPAPFIRVQKELKEAFPEVGVIRSIPLPPEGMGEDFPALALAGALEPVSDFFLTDTWMAEAPVQGYIGITGRVSDWGMARDLVHQCRIPVILAGGLSPENVRGALRAVRPSGADSCTGTNMRDAGGSPVRFKKDFQRVQRFVKEVRRVEGELEVL
jgi:phosphoribosylanthranilate isomerase